MKEVLKKDKIYIFIILLLSVIVMIPLLLGPSSLGHDTVFHVANIDSIKTQLESSLIPSKISPTVGNSLGYGTHLFYPMFPHTITAYLSNITELFGLSTLHTTVIMYLLITIISSIEIFYLSQKIHGNKKFALLSSVIFLFFPYRLGDMVVRSAFNEVFTFLFIPLVLLGLLYLLEDKDKKFYLAFIIGCLGMINSHLVLTLYYAILLIPFIIIYRKKFFKKERLKKFITAALIITVLALPTLIPLLEHKHATEYMIYVDGYMSGLNYMEAFCMSISEYFQILSDYSWDNPTYINYIVIGLLGLALYFFCKKEKKSEHETFLWIFTGIAFFITTRLFPWILLPKFLYLIQFPWRMLTMLTISISLLVPIVFKQIKKEKLQTILLITTILLIPISEIHLIKKLTNDTYQIGEIESNNGMGHSKEYLPKKAYDNLTYFEQRNQDIIILSGQANIIELENNNNKIKIKLEEITQETTIEFPRLYYLGYKLKDSTGNKISLKESQNGFLQATITDNETYTLTYERTTLQKIVSYLCIPTTGLFIYLIIKPRKKEEKS